MSEISSTDAAVLNGMGAGSPDRRWRVVRLLVWIVLFLWAGFWSTFVLLEVAGEGFKSWAHWRPAVQFLALLLGPFLVTLWRPRIGSVLLILVGLYDAWFFANHFTHATLAAPAILCGLALLLLPSRRR